MNEPKSDATMSVMAAWYQGFLITPIDATSTAAIALLQTLIGVMPCDSSP